MEKHKYSKKEIQDLAASYALGILAKKDRSKFKSILSEGDITDENELRGFRQVVNQLGFNSPQVKPPENLKEKLLTAVRSRRKSAK